MRRSLRRGNQISVIQILRRDDDIGLDRSVRIHVEGLVNEGYGAGSLRSVSNTDEEVQRALRRRSDTETVIVIRVNVAALEEVLVDGKRIKVLVVCGQRKELCGDLLKIAAEEGHVGKTAERLAKQLKRDRQIRIGKIIVYDRAFLVELRLVRVLHGDREGQRPVGRSYAVVIFAHGKSVKVEIADIIGINRSLVILVGNVTAGDGLIQHHVGAVKRFIVEIYVYLQIVFRSNGGIETVFVSRLVKGKFGFVKIRLSGVVNLNVLCKAMSVCGDPHRIGSVRNALEAGKHHTVSREEADRKIVAQHGLDASLIKRPGNEYLCDVVGKQTLIHARHALKIQTRIVHNNGNGDRIVAIVKADRKNVLADGER